MPIGSNHPARKPNRSPFPDRPRMRIYFAAPLFCAAEYDFNERLTARLEAAGFSVYLPQRDGPEKGRPPFNIADPYERREAIFTRDRDEVFAADILLFVADGRVPDEGACVELGLAYAQRRLEGRRKLLIGFHTDARGAFLGARLNPMLHVALDAIVHEEDALMAALEHYVRTSALPPE